MFRLFKLKPETTLSQRSLFMIRTDTRELIRIANRSQHTAGADAGTSPGARRKLEMHLLSSAERRLSGSIASAVSRSVSTEHIFRSAIEPVLGELPAVSTLAHDCIGRALSTADPR